MIPVIVVIVCFILLWGMVNYYSFVEKKKQILATLDSCVTAQARLGHALEDILAARKAQQQPLPASLRVMPDWLTLQPRKVVEEIVQEVDQLLNESYSPDDNLTQQRLNTYEEAKKWYFVARKKHRAAIIHYNEEATHMPSKIIAKLFGFQPA